MTRNHHLHGPVGATTALLAAGLLAGCGNGLSTSHGSPPAITGGTPATASATSTPSPPASGSVASSTQPSRPASPGSGSSAARNRSTPDSAGTAGVAEGPRTCGPGSLAVGLQTPRGGGAAGSQYELLTFRNISDSTCTVDGHPGVSFVGLGDGSQLGSAAARTGTVHAVRLAPGRSGTALLQVADAGNYDPSQCVPTTSDGLRVYPPDWRVSVFVELRTQACQRDPGTSPQLTVSAVR